MNAISFVDGLTDILVKRKVINSREAHALKKAFHDSPKPNFDEFLLDEGLIDKENLLLALSEYYQVPSLDAVGYFFDHQLLLMFPKEFLRTNAIIPIEQDENTMIMLANNPADPDLLLRIGRYVSYDIQFWVGILQDIYDSVQEFYDSPVTDTSDYDEDLDHNRHAREHEIEQEKEIEEISYEINKEDFD